MSKAICGVTSARATPDVASLIRATLAARSEAIGRFVIAGQSNSSPPAQRRGDVFEDRLDDVGVVVDPELVGHGEQERVGFGDGLVLLELLDQHVGLSGVAAAENGAPVVAEEADRVCVLV